MTRLTDLFSRSVRFLTAHGRISTVKRVWDAPPRLWCFMTCSEMRIACRWKTLCVARNYSDTATTCSIRLKPTIGRHLTWQTGPHLSAHFTITLSLIRMAVRSFGVSGSSPVASDGGVLLHDC